MAVSEAQKRATQRYEQKSYGKILVRLPKGYSESILKPAAERAGESVNAYVQNAIADRIARESAQEAAALGQAITALAEAHSKPYAVTYRIAEQFPSGTVKVAPTDAQKVVEASSEDEARVAFFRYVKDQMQAEVAFEDAEKIGMKRDDGVVEICKIVSVE